MTANGHTRLVLFDIDGTLLLTAGAGRRAIVAALRDEVEDPAAFAGIRFDGKTDPQIVVEMLEAAGQEESRESDRVRMLCRRYVELLALELERPTTRTTLMPGVLPLLDELEQRTEVGARFAHRQRRRRRRLEAPLRRIDPSRFRIGAYGSDAGHRPALPEIAARRAEAIFGRVPSGAEVVIIGDTPADIHCGQGISARALGVATGSYSVDDLSSCGAHAVFADLSDTERVLEAILG